MNPLGLIVAMVRTGAVMVPSDLAPGPQKLQITAGAARTRRRRSCRDGKSCGVSAELNYGAIGTWVECAGREPAKWE
jgi:hypothetical protein